MMKLKLIKLIKLLILYTTSLNRFGIKKKYLKLKIQKFLNINNFCLLVLIYLIFFLLLEIL